MADHAWRAKSSPIWQFKCEHKGRTYRQSLRTTDKRIAKAEAARLYLKILEGTYRSPAEIKRAEKQAERKIIESPTVRECYERYVTEKLKDVPKLWHNARLAEKINTIISTNRNVANARFYWPKNLKMSQVTHADLLDFVDKLANYEVVAEPIPHDFDNCQMYAKHYKIVQRSKKLNSSTQVHFFKAIVNKCKKVWNIDAPDILPNPSSSALVHTKLNFETGLRFYEVIAEKKPSKPKHLSKEELQQSLQILEDKWPAGCDLFLFQFFTGCRIGNAIGLLWQDIDWDHNIITMSESIGPLGTSYTIPMTPQIISLLDKKRKEHADNKINNMFVFNYRIAGSGKRLRGYKTGDFKPFEKVYVHKKLNRILKENNVKWTTHQLRHTAAASLLSTGNASLKHVQEQLGHKNINTTMVYAHLDKSELSRKTSQAIDSYLNSKTVRNTVPFPKLKLTN